MRATRVRRRRLVHATGIKVRQFMAKSVFRRPHKLRAISWPLLEALVCLVSLSGVSSAHALAFGPVRVLSATGQPLRLEVDLLDVRETPVSARALPTSEERDRFFDKPLGYDVKTEIKRQPDGRYILRLTSSQPIAQPALKFALEVDDGEGVLARDFSVRLGAAETATRAPAPAPEPAQTRAAPPCRHRQPLRHRRQHPRRRHRRPLPQRLHPHPRRPPWPRPRQGRDWHRRLPHSHRPPPPGRLPLPDRQRAPVRRRSPYANPCARPRARWLPANFPAVHRTTPPREDVAAPGRPTSAPSSKRC